MKKTFTAACTALTVMILMAVMAINALAMPAVTPLSPASGITVNTLSNTFTFSVTSNQNATACSFITNATGVSGTTVLPSINTTTGFATASFTLGMSDNQNLFWRVQCDDTNGTADTFNSTLSIREVPVITSVPGTAATRNRNYSYQVTATDAEGIRFPFTSAALIAAPAGMTISQTGLIAWTPTATGQFPVTVRVTDNVGLTADQSFTITVETDSPLRIINVRLELNGNDWDLRNFQTADSTDTILGSKIAMDIDVQNIQPSGDDIEKVETKVTIKDLDDTEDVKGTISSFTLSGADHEERSVKLGMDSIPFTAKYKTYEVRIDTKGKNSTNGVTFSDAWTVYFKVYKDEDPNIKISELALFPTTITCDRNFNLDIKGLNIGDSDDNVVVKIESAILKIFEVKEFGMGDNPNDDCNAMEEPDQGCFLFEGSFDYKADANLAAGTYPITVTTYYDTTRQSDKKTINLAVGKCEAAPTTPAPTTPTTPAPTTPTTPITPPKEPIVEVKEVTAPISAPSSTPVRIIEKSTFADSQTYTLLLVLANIGLFAIIIAVLKQAFTKK